MQRRLTRRAFLTRGALSGGGAALATVLAACQSGTAPATGVATATSVSATQARPRLSPPGTLATSPRIELTPNPALADAQVAIRLAGFPPSREVTLRARLPDDGGQRWESYAVFETDARGTVEVAARAPLSGTYAGVDPMGLVWSALPASGVEGAQAYRQATLAPRRLTFVAEVAVAAVATADLERLSVAPEVIRSQANEQGLYGTLFRPAGPGPHPAVLVLGGSEGGLGVVVLRTAALLASHGYAALVLAYFGGGTLPLRLENVPLEYFEGAIGWLQAQPAVRGDRLAVLGVSRGGELALLLGATFPEFKAVVSYVGSGMIFPSPDGPRPAWTYRGVPLPFVPLYSAIDDPDVRERTSIPVGRIAGSVLLISGEDDQLWPSALLSQIASDRLTQSGHPYPHEHLRYASAGHLIGLPYFPTAGRHIGRRDYGGTAQGNAFANADSWPRVLALLRDSLRR